MSHYQYHNDSTVSEISIRKTPGGGARCYVFAKKDVTPAEAETIRTTLSASHLSCVASEMDNKPCLEVRGCKDIKVLENILRPKGMIQGPAEVDHSDNQKVSIANFVRHNMVAIYGAINVVADIGIVIYSNMKTSLGKKSAKAAVEHAVKEFETLKKSVSVHPDTMLAAETKIKNAKLLETESHQSSSRFDEAAAYSYSVGSVLFTIFGRGDKSDYHAHDVAKKLKTELAARGINLQQDSAAESFLRRAERQSVVKKSGNYLNKMGSDAGNIATGSAGGFMMAAALGKKDKNVRDAVLGATTLASGFGAALIKEKQPDEEHKPTSTYGKIKQWVQERPNRLAGYGYMASTVMHGYEAQSKYRSAPKDYSKEQYGEKHGEFSKKARQAYGFRGAFAGMNFLGEILLATASKGHGSGVKSSDSVEDTAISIVADAIVRQPQDKRDGLVADLSRKFLANPEVMGGDPDMLEGRLSQQVHKFEQNPWLKATAANSAGTAQSENLPGQQEKLKTWATDKVAKVATVPKEKAENFLSAVEKRNAESQLAVGK